MAAPRPAPARGSHPEPRLGEAAPKGRPTVQTLIANLAPEVQRTLCQASELGRRRRDRLREVPLPTTVPALDEVLGGGLPRGAMVELVGRGSCGRMASLLAAVKTVTDGGEVAALVDLGGHLDPQVAAAVGVDLERLLWICPARLDDALAGAEALVHTGFPLIALDLGLPPVRGRAPLAAWLRLARGAATQRCAVLVSSPYRLSGCAAAAVVSARSRRGRWSGAVGSPRLLTGISTSFTLTRQPGKSPGETRAALLVVPETISETVSTSTPVTLQRSNVQTL